MTEIPTFYQVCYFTDLADLEPSAQTITPMMKALQDYGVLPSTLQEINLQGKSQTRLRFSTPVNEEWRIQFESNRINIMKQGVDLKGEKIGTLDNFLRDAQQILIKVLEVHPKRATRLALVTNYLSKKFSAEELQAIHPKAISPLRFYLENEPHEWSTRQATRIKKALNEREETLNAILEMLRVQGEFSSPEHQEKFDRIQVKIDINTFQENRESRFEGQDMTTFTQIAKQIIAQLSEQIAATYHE